MMKSVLLLGVTLLAVVTAHPGNLRHQLHHGVRSHPRVSRSLQSDFDEIKALIPIEEITAIALNYLANDAEVQAVMAYAQSAEFHSIVSTMDNNAEYINFLLYLLNAGVDPYPVVNQFHELIGMDPITPPPMLRRRVSRSIKSMFDEIVAIIPLDEIQALVQKKLAESPEFKAFYDKIGSPEFQSIIETLRALPEYQLLKEKLIGYGIDVEAIITYFKNLFGLPAFVVSKSARSLQSDFDEIKALIPIEEITAIALNYLANDAEVQAVMAYAQSAEFHSIVSTMDNNAEYINFLLYLLNAGVDPYPVVNQFHELIGMDPITPPPMLRRRVSRSIKSMFDEIVAIIPLDEIQALVQKKLAESPEFKAFYDKIGSPEFQSIIETLRALPEYQLLKEKLIGYGIDVEGIITYFKNLFGLPAFVVSKSARSLQSDFDEIKALIPIEEITAIALNYLANDAEVQAVMAYAQSAEFHSIVSTMDNNAEYINFLLYLLNAGVDPYPVVNQFHELIGMDPITPPPMLRRRVSRSIKSMFDEIVAIIPLDEIQALVQKKLAESPEFKAFYDKIGSPEFQSIIETLRALPEYQLLKEKLIGYGIDVEAIITYFKNLFGLPAFVVSKSARSLQSDFDEIKALIPIEEITAIALNYLANDAEVQAVMAYAQSAEFHSIVSTMDNNAEYINFLLYLLNAGVDPYPVVNQFHELIGMDPITPPPMLRRRVSRSIKSMFDEIVAIIPLDEIQALVQKKLAESPEFKAFYDKIGSPEFQSIIETLRALPEYQLLKEKLIGYGIDVEAIITYFKNLFGLPAFVVSKSARSLQSDFDEIKALIPIEEITAIALNYLANDAEVQAVMAYAQSAEFHSIVSTMDNNAEYINFLLYLLNAGVDPYPVVNQFHELIGMDPITPPPMLRRRVSRSIKSMFDEIVAIIPLDEIQALVQKKLAESPEFKAFYDKIGSPEFQSIIETLRALPEYQLLKEKLIGYGIDVEGIITYFKNLFGLPAF